MSSSYVCQTCRRELRRQLRLRRQPQWQRRATFISFNDIVPPRQEQPTPQSEHAAAPRPPPRRRSKDPDDVEAVFNKPEESATQRNGTGRYSKYKPEPLPTASDDFPINLDNLRALQATGLSPRGLDSLTPSEALRLNPPPRTEELSPPFQRPLAAIQASGSGDDGPAVKLWNILSQENVDAKEAWEFFREHYILPGKDGEALRRPSSRDQRVIRRQQLFRELLRKVATQWQPGDDALPSPGEMVATMHEYGIMAPAWYLREILEMLYRILKTSAALGQSETSETVVILEEQILLLWSQLFRNDPSQWWIAKDGNHLKASPTSVSQEAKIDWTGLPDYSALNFSKILGGDAYRFSFRLHRMFNSVPSGSAQHLAVAALLTFDHFAHRYCNQYATPNPRIPYTPFMQLILHTLHGSQDTDITVALSKSLLEANDVPTAQLEAIHARLLMMKHRAALAFAIDDLQILGSESITLTEEQDNKLVGYFHGRIKRQIERENLAVIDQLWQEAQLAYGFISSKPSSSSEGGEGDVPTSMIPPKIYSAFLFGYRDLNEPERQTLIWNHMLSQNMTPTHEQWGLMISARMKHLSSMEHVWERMMASGTRADLQTWCTRLSAHIYHGQPEEGIALLYEWGNKWLNEIKAIYEEQKIPLPEMKFLNRDAPKTPRPGTDALTTVVTALVQRKSEFTGSLHRRLDLIPDAFAWATQFGVKPNLWTYNTLFRTCLKDDNLKEAMQILKKMEEDEIMPDEFTFYGFADFVFRQASRSAMTREDQYRLVVNILDLLERRGLEPSKVFFGSMIDSLLKTGNRWGSLANATSPSKSQMGVEGEGEKEPNLPAAMMLLRIMLEKEITIPSHIWTSLMTYHFQEGRRTGTLDTNAIDSLWRTMNERILHLDTYFYDRMIEGFSSFGLVDRAWSMLERQQKQGKRTGYSALSALLEALVRENLMDKARGLVVDVVERSGLFFGGVRHGDETRKNPARERFFEIAERAGLLEGQDVDRQAVREYVVNADGAMAMPMGVGDGYGGSSAYGRDGFEEGSMPEDEEAGQGGVRSIEEIEREFNKTFDLTPGWEEVVDNPRRDRRRS